MNISEYIKSIVEAMMVVLMVAMGMGNANTSAKPKYTQEDIDLLAEVMYHENWYTDSEHLAAYYTGAVVLNRVRSKDFPNSIRGVVYQKGQYAVTGELFTVDIPEECYAMAESILRDGTDDVPETVVFQATFRQGSGVWKKVNTDYFCYG